MATLAAIAPASNRRSKVELYGADPAVDGVLEVRVPFSDTFDGDRNGTAGRADRTVEVDVEVDSAGTVVAAAARSRTAHPTLASWSEEAAFEWRFEPTNDSSAQSRTLTFVFEGVVPEAEPQLADTRYVSPLTLHVLLMQPTVMVIDREHGAIPEKSCQVHDAAMSVELVPIGYGLIIGPSPNSAEGRKRARFWRALKKDLPNAPQEHDGGCVMSAETRAEVYICPACRAARDRWLEDHAGFEALW
jgi:hypothetical protein